MMYVFQISTDTGATRFSGVDFSGTLQVETKHDDDFIGLVFSYQSNRKFYLVSWKQENQVYWEMNPFRAKALRGIQIKVLFGVLLQASASARWSNANPSL